MPPLSACAVPFDGDRVLLSADVLLAGSPARIGARAYIHASVAKRRGARPRLGPLGAGAKISLHGVSGAAKPARPWAMGRREPLAAKAGGPPARMPHRPNRHDAAAVTPHETDSGASPPTTAQPHE